MLFWRPSAVLLALLTAALAWPSRTPGADDSVAFMDAMRDQGHFELALDYLELAKADPLTPDSFRIRLDYERAVTLLEQAQSLSSPQARAVAVESARRDLESFISGNANPELAAEASGKLAAALVAVLAGRSTPARRLSKPDQKAAIAKARSSIDDARDYYAKAEGLFDKALEQLKSVQPGSPEAQQRLTLRFQLAQSRLASATALMEKAETYGAKSKPFNQLMEEAAQTFAELYEKYDTQQSAGIGFYAHLYEGRCYQAMGDHRLADGCFELLLTLPPEEPSFRRLITLAHAYHTIGLVQQNQLAKALRRGRRLARRAQPR